MPTTNAAALGAGFEDHHPHRDSNLEPPHDAEKLPVKRLPITLSRNESKLLEAATLISTASPASDDMAFMHSIMCQVGLPRSKVLGTQFARRSGNATLLIEAGQLWDGAQFVQQPLPYGATPRLILAWMNTYAVKHRTPEIALGESAAEFLRLLGKKTCTGGKTGSLTSLRYQINALAACRLTLGFNLNGHAHTYAGMPVSHFEAWLKSSDKAEPRQRSLWPAKIVFSQEYFTTLCDHAVPLDLRAYSALSGSALALDVYMWTAARLWRLEKPNLLLHWKSIRDQFGQEYQGKNADKDFKKKFLTALSSVLAVYPQARIKPVHTGLLLLPSPPPVLPST